MNTDTEDGAAQPAVDATAFWPLFAPDLPAERVLWSEIIPGGGHWSWRLSRGVSLRFCALDERANGAVVLYVAHDKLERYSMPDTCKALHTALLTRGHVLMSDMGRAMASITRDSLGGHDPFGALLDTPRMQQRYGEQRFCKQRNAMQRSGRDGLLIEIGKHGLPERELITPVNLFSRLSVDAEGRFAFDAERPVQGHCVELRCEMDLLLAIATAPHPLDPRAHYRPGRIGVAAWRSGPAPADDFCRHFRAECARAMHNADVFAQS